MGRSARMEGPQSLREEHSSPTEEGKTEREAHRPSVPARKMPQAEKNRVNHKVAPIWLLADFTTETHRPEESGKIYSK